MLIMDLNAVGQLCGYRDNKYQSTDEDFCIHAAYWPPAFEAGGHICLFS
jgi:hypothetical protein